MQFSTKFLGRRPRRDVPAELEGFSFFRFSFRSVTIFMLRGLLRLGVLPGLCGGTVSGRGEGEVYEVARDAGEVRSLPFFCRERETMISSNCSCLYL